MTWTPINPAHAIERVRVIVKFRGDIPGKVSREMAEMVAKLRHDTRLDGPIPLSNFNIALQVNAEGQAVMAPQQTAVPQGWQFSRNSTAGQAIEQIAVASDQIIYETVEYRRWGTFKQRFSKVVGSSFDLTSKILDIDMISLEYFDRFFFDGPLHSAVPTDLLVGMEHILHKDALSGRNLWHLHRGWYEASASGDVLVNQNFDVSEVVPPSRSELARVVAIYTKIDLRADVYDVEGQSVFTQLDFLHDLSKQYFKSALQPKMRNSVGISEI